VKKVAEIPSGEGVPILGVLTGPRAWRWHPLEAATVVWVEALDGGDLRTKAPYRDRWVTLKAPFTGEPAEIMKTANRSQGISWTEKGLTLITEVSRDKQRIRTTWLIEGSAAPRKLWELNASDRYKDPGTPVVKMTGPGAFRTILQVGDVIYLHSQLVQHRNGDTTIKGKKRHLKMEKIDVVIAMNIAFIVNAAMVIVSAAVFFSKSMAVDSIEQAHRSLEPLLGRLSSGAFGIALLASGFSSSAVGAMAGETMMDGFVNVKIPVNVRRLITMLPAMLIVILGVNPMKALVLSQVSLSFALPFAIIPLLLITNRKDIMGAFVNKKATKALGFIIATMIIVLNVVLLYLTFTGSI
jgi:hypothetical protein